MYNYDYFSYEDDHLLYQRDQRDYNPTRGPSHSGSLIQTYPRNIYSQESSYTPYRENYFNLIEDEDDFYPYELGGHALRVFPTTSIKQLHFRRRTPTENMLKCYPSYYFEEKIHTKSERKEEDYVQLSPEMIPFESPEILPFESYGEEEVNEKKRKYDDVNEEGEIPLGFKLPASKSPIMEALAYSAINKWGIEILQAEDQTDETEAKVVFHVIDFEVYYKYSSAICSKQNPTEDIGSRVKSLRRWFVNFPKKRDRKDLNNFSLEVKSEVAKKVFDMIDKYKCEMKVNNKKRRIM